MTRAITIVVLFVSAAALVVWDIVVAANSVPGDTISEITLAFTQGHPVAGMGITLAIGIILGHLFWPQYRSPPMSEGESK